MIASPDRDRSDRRVRFGFAVLVAANLLLIGAIVAWWIV